MTSTACVFFEESESLHHYEITSIAGHITDRLAELGDS